MRRALAAAALLAACGCGPEGGVRAGALLPGPAAFAARDVSFGAFRLLWEGSGVADARLRVLHAERPAPLWETLPGTSFLSAGAGSAVYHETRGSFRIEDAVGERCPRHSVDAVEATAVGARVTGRLDCGGRSVAFTLRLEAGGDRELRLEAATADPALNRLVLTFALDPEARVFGFGQQFTHFDLSGRRVPVFVSEQGIGRGSQPLTWLVDLVASAGGDWSWSYAPVPHFTTTQRRSFFLENTEYSVFDLREPGRVAVELFSPRLEARVLHGEDPLELLRGYTAWAGRMRPLPDWASRGAVLGLQGGPARVREALAGLEAEGAPVAAVWLQDWVGRRTTSFGEQLWWSWALDRERYPEWETLVAELHARDVRVLLYVNPFLVDTAERAGGGRDMLAEALERDLLVKGADGNPVFVTITDFDAALLDLTNPAARDWIKGVIRDEMLGIGASGWMADFGEALPVDSVLASGESAAAYHNRYPVEWARVNREVIEEAGRGDDVVFFTRAGYSRSPAYSTLFWEGDQLVSWDRHDGLASAVTGLLSGGLSGFSLNHSDIGGYTTLDRPLVGVRRSRELFWRWTELAAFTAVFRTHEGSLPAANHQFDSDPETLRHFARFAKVYAAWGFYRKQLLREAAQHGWPIARHPYLHHPDERAFWDLDSQQFLVGDALWVAPALEPGAQEVTVRLPAGRFVHVFTGAVVESAGPEHPVRVSARLGEPAVLYRDGSKVGRRFRANLVEAGVLAR